MVRLCKAADLQTMVILWATNFVMFNGYKSLKVILSFVLFHGRMSDHTDLSFAIRGVLTFNLDPSHSA